MAAAVVGGVSLIAREPLVFILGGSMIIGLSWWHRQAHSVNPQLEALKRNAGVSGTSMVPTPGSSDVMEPVVSESETMGGMF